MEAYLSTKEAAEVLGLTERRVRQLAGDLGAVNMVGRLVYPRKKVEAAAKKPRPKRGPKPKSPTVPR